MKQITNLKWVNSAQVWESKPRYGRNRNGRLQPIMTHKLPREMNNIAAMLKSDKNCLAYPTDEIMNILEKQKIQIMI